MIPFIKPFFDGDDLAEIEKVLNSGWVAQGPKCEEFEEAICKYLGCAYAITVSSCTAALYLALIALGIKEGDEVIVPDYTFPATALAVLHAGAIPIIVDVDPFSYNVTAEHIEEAITERTKAVIPVHLFGRVCDDMDVIIDVADRNALVVIEDAACSLGAVFPYPSESFAGTVGDVGCFSLHASKGITTGEGGICVTNDKETADKIRLLSSFGDERAFRRVKGHDFSFHRQGFNFKMSDIVAAIGIAQLRKIDKLIEWRMKVAKEWGEIIAEDSYLRSAFKPPEMIFDRSHIYQSIVGVTKQGFRESVNKYITDRKIQTGIGTHACHRYNLAFPSSGNFPVSSYLFENAISLPRYYGLEIKKSWLLG